MSNYKAIVAKIDTVTPIPNADRIQVATVLGESVIVSKDLNVGYVGVLFVAGTQLSEKYCSENNLYRDSQKNKDATKSGFFDDNRKVRAQPFLKMRSEGYFAPLESLSFTGYDVSTLKIGDSFEELKGVEVCKKYINPHAKKVNNQPKAKKKRLVPDFTEHMDTEQFKREFHKIKKGMLVSIQSKIHGTSGRYGYHKVEVELPWWKKAINKVVKLFPEKEWQHVVGTRRVVLNDPEKEGFHGKEQYRFDVLEMLKPYMTKGMTIYGEIAGYANGSPIMSKHQTKDLKDKKYTKKYGDEMIYKYGCTEESFRFHVYRITLTTEGGEVIDFSQPYLVKWCKDRGLLPSYDLVEPFVFNGDYDDLGALVNELTERPDVLTEDYHDPSHISEGVIIRADGQSGKPIFLKNKSYAFKCLESICEAIDVEDIS